MKDFQVSGPSYKDGTRGKEGGWVMRFSEGNKPPVLGAPV
jgi:hypothetical protein